MPGRRLKTQFRRTLNAGIKRTRDEVIAFQKDHAWAFEQEVVSRTPVKSGDLAGSWRSSAGAPNTGIPSAPRPEIRAEFEENTKSLTLGGSVFISNGQPYARRIEHGHGKNNPPTGFVRPALLAYRKRLKRLK